jgi:hypothetical protein
MDRMVYPFNLDNLKYAGLGCMGEEGVVNRDLWRAVPSQLLKEL